VYILYPVLIAIKFPFLLTIIPLPYILSLPTIVRPRVHPLIVPHILDYVITHPYRARADL
jgi:hypothetical protein